MKQYTLTGWRGPHATFYQEVGPYDHMVQLMVREMAHIAPPEEIRLGEMPDRPGEYLAYVGDHFDKRNLHFVIAPIA